MDVLTRHVDEFRRDETLSPMVRNAAKRGRKILDKYYSRTDETIIFRIAMGMFYTQRLCAELGLPFGQCCTLE